MTTESSIQVALKCVGLEVPAPDTVLVVDDEPENLEVLEAVLEDECEVVTAGSPLAALELLEAGERVDVLIADQRMPQMTGVEMLAQVAATHPQIVRMVLTAYTDVEPMIEAVNRGDVHRFLLKPCDPHEMRAVVADALQLKWSRTALREVVAALATQNQALYETQLQLVEAREQLLSRTRLATLGRLAAGIAHDVRNCSAIISLLIEYIRSKESADEAALSMAQTIVDGSRPLLELLEHARQLARPPAEKQKVRAASLVAEVLDSLRRGPGVCPGVEVELVDAAVPIEVDLEAMHQTLVAVLRGTARDQGSQQPLELALRPGPTNSTLCFEVRGAPTGEVATVAPAATEEPLEIRFARLTADAQGAKLRSRRRPTGELVTQVLFERSRPEASRC